MTQITEDPAPGSLYISEPANPDSYRSARSLIQIGSQDEHLTLWINRREVTPDLALLIIGKVFRDLSIGHLEKITGPMSLDLEKWRRRLVSGAEG